MLSSCHSLFFFPFHNQISRMFSILIVSTFCLAYSSTLGHQTSTSSCAWRLLSSRSPGYVLANSKGHFPFLFCLISQQHLTLLRTPCTQILFPLSSMTSLPLFSSYLSGNYSSVFFNPFSDYCSNVPTLFPALSGYILLHLICSVSI